MCSKRLPNRLIKKSFRAYNTEDKKKLLLILSSYLTAAERTGLVNKFSHEIESYNINLLLAFLTEQNFISCDNIDTIKNSYNTFEQQRSILIKKGLSLKSGRPQTSILSSVPEALHVFLSKAL